MFETRQKLELNVHHVFDEMPMSPIQVGHFSFLACLRIFTEPFILLPFNCFSNLSSHVFSQQHSFLVSEVQWTFRIP